MTKAFFKYSIYFLIVFKLISDLIQLLNVDNIFEGLLSEPTQEAKTFIKSFNS